MDSSPETSTVNMDNDNLSVVAVSENARKRKHAEEVADTVYNWHLNNEKFSELPLSTCILKKFDEKQVHSVKSATSDSKKRQCNQNLNYKIKLSQLPNQIPCSSENEQISTDSQTSIGFNYNQMKEQNTDFNRNRIEIYSETPMWNVNNSQRPLLNCHSFQHRLYVKQQLEMERRRVSLLKNSSRNMFGFSHTLMGQIGRGITCSQTDEKVLKLKRLLTANTRIFSSEETVNMEEATCVICFMKFKEKQLVRELACQHKFHKSCIDKWLLSQMNCPICRLPLEDNFSVNNSATTLDVNWLADDNFLSDSVPVGSQYFQRNELSNSLNDGPDRNFENNLTIPLENNLNNIKDSRQDANNENKEKLLHCNQPESTKQSKETTDRVSDCSTIELKC